MVMATQDLLLAKTPRRSVNGRVRESVRLARRAVYARLVTVLRHATYL